MASEEVPFGILSLSDDCFEYIFAWLTFDELCSIGGVCKHLQYIAGQYFRRKYPAKTMKISRKFGKTLIDPCGIENFSNFVQNIEIDGSEVELFEFIHLNCSEKIRKLSLSGCHMLSNQHIDHLIRILHNVDTIELQCCVFAHGFYETFLKHCQSMQKLTIKSFLYEWQYGRCGNWLKQHYSTLKHFEYDGFDILDELRIFFQLNPNIQSFSSSSDMLQNLFRINQMVKFRKITLKLKPSRLDGIERVCDQLKILYAEQRFVEMHLMIDDKGTFLNNIEKITLLDGVDALTLDFCFVTDVETTASLQMLGMWTNLNELHIKSIGGDAEALAHKLHGLKVLRVDEDSMDIITPIVRNCSQMHKLLIGKIKTSTDVPCIAKLNKYRLNHNWSKLVVYVEESGFVRVRNASGTMKFPTIEIKLIDAQF